MADDGLDNVVSKAAAAPLTSLDGVSVRISRREICNEVLDVDRRSALLKELDGWNANAVVAGPAREERIAAATTMVFMVIDAHSIDFAMIVDVLAFCIFSSFIASLMILTHLFYLSFSKHCKDLQRFEYEL